MWLGALRFETGGPCEDVRLSAGVVFGGLIERSESLGFCSGDAELVLALLSRSSSLFFSFLPVQC